MKTPSKEYIGDSVYVDFDGFSIVLTTENGYPDDPRNMIVLEPEVYAALTQYVSRIKTPATTTPLKALPLNKYFTRRFVADCRRVGSMCHTMTVNPPCL